MKSREKVEKLAQRITKTLEEMQEEESDQTHVLVRAKNLRALSNGLRGIIDETDDERLREMLSNIKAGLDWIVENKSITLSEPEVERLKAKATSQ